MYLVSGQILNDVASHLFFFRRVWVEGGNFHGAQSIFHPDKRLAFLAICELFFLRFLFPTMRGPFLFSAFLLSPFGVDFVFLLWADAEGACFISGVCTFCVLRVLFFASVLFSLCRVVRLPQLLLLAFSGWDFPYPSPWWHACVVFVGSGRPRTC